MIPIGKYKVTHQEGLPNNRVRLSMEYKDPTTGFKHTLMLELADSWGLALTKRIVEGDPEGMGAVEVVGCGAYKIALCGSPEDAD